MSNMLKYMKAIFGKDGLGKFLRMEKNDGYDQARENAALECFKTGKTILGKIYPDGRVEVEKVVENKEEGSMAETLKGAVKWFA